MADHPPPECTPFPPPAEDGSDPLAFDPAWGTETVRGLARVVSEDDAFDLLPILADALEDAGCDNRALLDHCRLCPAHDPDCWAVRFVLFALEPPRPPDPAPAPAPAAPVLRLTAADADRASPGAQLIARLVLLGVLALPGLVRQVPSGPAPPALPPAPVAKPFDPAPPFIVVPRAEPTQVSPPSDETIRRLAEHYRQSGQAAEAKRLDDHLKAAREARDRQGAGSAVTGSR